MSQGVVRSPSYLWADWLIFRSARVHLEKDKPEYVNLDNLTGILWDQGYISQANYACSRTN